MHEIPATVLLSRCAEDVVSADTTPHHVRDPWPNLVSVLPGGASVGGERHFPHRLRALDPLDSQAGSKLARAEIMDEVPNSGLEPSALLWRETFPISTEGGANIEGGWHQLAGQGIEELVR